MKKAKQLPLMLNFAEKAPAQAAAKTQAKTITQTQAKTKAQTQAQAKAQAQPQTPITPKQYDTAKQNLKQKEKTNDNRIYLIPCSGDKGWHEIAENSALFYYYEIIQRYGLKNKFFEDSLSFQNPYIIGYIRVQDIDNVRIWLKKAKLYQTEGRDSQKTFYFELTKTFSEREIKALQDKEKERRKAMSTITPARNLSPEFYQLLINLGQRIIPTLSRRVPTIIRDTVGGDIVRSITAALEIYHAITELKPSEITALQSNWAKIHQNLHAAILEFKVLSDFKQLNYDACIAINAGLNRLAVIAKQEHKKLVKRQNQLNKSTNN